MAPKTKAPVSYTPFSAKLTESLGQISRTIEDNAQMIDLLQELALELTTSIGTLHTLTVKYAGVANSVLDVILPILRNVPIVPKNVMEMLTNLERITQKIIDNQESTSRTIADVEAGLRTADVTKLQSHADDLQKLTRSLTAILPK